MTRKAYLASIVPVVVNAILNEHQIVVDIVAFVNKGDFPRSRLYEKQRGKILAGWVTRKMRTMAQFAIRDMDPSTMAAMMGTSGAAAAAAALMGPDAQLDDVDRRSAASSSNNNDSNAHTVAGSIRGPAPPGPANSSLRFMELPPPPQNDNNSGNLEYRQQITPQQMPPQQMSPQQIVPQQMAAMGPGPSQTTPGLPEMPASDNDVRKGQGYDNMHSPALNMATANPTTASATSPNESRTTDSTAATQQQQRALAPASQQQQQSTRLSIISPAHGFVDVPDFGEFAIDEPPSATLFGSAPSQRNNNVTSSQQPQSPPPSGPLPPAPPVKQPQQPYPGNRVPYLLQSEPPPPPPPVDNGGPSATTGGIGGAATEPKSTAAKMHQARVSDGSDEDWTRDAVLQLSLAGALEQSGSGTGHGSGGA